MLGVEKRGGFRSTNSAIELSSVLCIAGVGCWVLIGVFVVSRDMYRRW